jgi:Protein kinase domain
MNSMSSMGGANFTGGSQMSVDSIKNQMTVMHISNPSNGKQTPS